MWKTCNEANSQIEKYFISPKKGVMGFFLKKSLVQKQLSLGFNLVYWYWAQAQVYKTHEFKDEKRVKEMVLNKTRSGFRVEPF